MSKPRRDLYRELGIAADASMRDVRRAFRARLLELHPDKNGACNDPDRFDAVMLAYEVLGDPHQRDAYDRAEELRRRHSAPIETLPHVTESERPIDRARAVLFLLLEQRGDEALERLNQLDGWPADYLEHYLDDEECIDAAFLVGELYEQRQSYLEALIWYHRVLRLEQRRRHHRPCHAETIERVKRLLVHRLSSRVDPRVRLEYLRRAEALGIDRPMSIEVYKRRAQAYLELDMKVEAARWLNAALTMQPQLKGIRRLRDDLAGYL